MSRACSVGLRHTRARTVPLDPQIEKLLKQPAMDGEGAHDESLADVRAGFERIADWQGEPEEVGRVFEETVPGNVTVRVYQPSDEPSETVLVFMHGGAWRLGSLEVVDHPCRYFTRAGRCTVVSVDYRLAPEHPFPAALDDVMAALRWVSEEPAELGSRQCRIVVGGESAGGNLAAAAALRCRDEGGPALVAQLLVYPNTDHDLERPSYHEHDGLLITREQMRVAWDDYIPDAAARDHPYASPLRAPDLSGAAPATVLTCEYDPLRDEGQAYAERLRAAGVPVHAKSYPGLSHGILYMGALVDGAREVFDDIAQVLRSV